MIVDGKMLPTTFGSERADWHWQPGGTVDMSGKQATVVLHDLTGFEGRCDAILFSSDDLAPPNREPEMSAFRRKLLGLPDTPPDAGQYDLVRGWRWHGRLLHGGFRRSIGRQGGSGPRSAATRREQ